MAGATVMRKYFPSMFESGRKVIRGITVIEGDKVCQIFERPEYTPVQVAELCDWLNEREHGYPKNWMPYSSLPL